MKRFLFRLILICIFGGIFYYLGKRASESHPPYIHPQKKEIPPSTTYTPELTAPVPAKDVPVLERINQETVKVAQSVLPSVVSVTTTKNDSSDAMAPDDGDAPHVIIPPPAPGGSSKKHSRPMPHENSLGSGVLISKEGHIITNSHVIKDADEVEVSLYDNRKFKAKVLGVDEMGDIAVLKIEGDNFKPLAWGDSSAIQVGEMVLAIGNPFNFNESVSSGIVSAKGRNPGFTHGSYEDFLQTTAAINPGNSGGALVNIRGELIGINTAIASMSRGFQGVGFAIPSNLARFAIESLIRNHGRVIRGYIGVQIQDVKEVKDFYDLPSEEGALVDDVQEKSPAEDAGIRQGDIITEFDGQKVTDTAHLRLAVSQTPINKQVQVVVLRDNKPVNVNLRVKELPADLAQGGEAQSADEGVNLQNALAGIHVQNIDDAVRSRLKLRPKESGLLITSIDRNSTAEFKGLRADDIIEAIKPKGSEDYFKTMDVKAYFDFASKIKPDQDILLLIRRGHGPTNFITLPGQTPGQ